MAIRVTFRQCQSLCDSEGKSSCHSLTADASALAHSRISDMCRDDITEAFNVGLDNGDYYRETSFDGTQLFSRSACMGFGRSVADFVCRSSGQRGINNPPPRFTEAPKPRKEQVVDHAAATKPARPNRQRVAVKVETETQGAPARANSQNVNPLKKIIRSGRAWVVPQGIIPGAAPADVPAR